MGLVEYREVVETESITSSPKIDCCLKLLFSLNQFGVLRAAQIIIATALNLPYITQLTSHRDPHYRISRRYRLSLAASYQQFHGEPVSVRLRRVATD